MRRFQRLRLHAEPAVAPSAELAAIEAVVAGHRTLEEVVRWAFGETPPRLFAQARTAGLGDREARVTEAPGFDLYVQDEYTHDVVVPWDSEGRLFLVYDTT